MSQSVSGSRSRIAASTSLFREHTRCSVLDVVRFVDAGSHLLEQLRADAGMRRHVFAHKAGFVVVDIEYGHQRPATTISFSHSRLTILLRECPAPLGDRPKRLLVRVTVSVQYEGVLLAGYVGQTAGATDRLIGDDRSVELPSRATERKVRQLVTLQPPTVLTHRLLPEVVRKFSPGLLELNGLAEIDNFGAHIFTWQLLIMAPVDYVASLPQLLSQRHVSVRNFRLLH